MDVVDRVSQLKLTHVHNIFNDKCPSYMHDNFRKLSNVHTYRTRGSSYNFFCTKYKGMSKQTFYYTSILLWNSLPNSLKCIESKESFKCELKKDYTSEMLRKEAGVFYYY